MDIHVRKLGAFNIIFGGLSLLGAAVMFGLYGGLLGIYHSSEDPIVGGLLTGVVTFHLLLGLPCVIGGLYLRSLTEWSRSLLIVTSALNILNLPIGTFLGCYGLWVLFAPETEPLFANQPRMRRKKRPAPKLVAPKQAPTTTTVISTPRS